MERNEPRHVLGRAFGGGEPINASTSSSVSGGRTGAPVGLDVASRLSATTRVPPHWGQTTGELSPADDTVNVDEHCKHFSERDMVMTPKNRMKKPNK